MSHDGALSNNSQAMKEEETIDKSKLSPEDVVMIKLKRATPHRPPNVFSSFATVNARCAIHLLLIQAVNEIFFEHYAHMSMDNIESFLEAIMSGHRFAYSANNDVRLRSALGPTGVMTRIIRIEITALSSCLRVLFKLYSEPPGSERREIGEKKLTKYFPLPISTAMCLRCLRFLLETTGWSLSSWRSSSTQP